MHALHAVTYTVTETYKCEGKYQDERLACFGTAVVCCLHWVCRS